MQLSNSLGASSYPYCALLAFSGSRTQLIAAIQGTRSPEALLAALRHAVDRHGSHLAVEQADHNQRVSQQRPGLAQLFCQPARLQRLSGLALDACMHAFA